jgi:hypothetical protein
MYSLWPRFNVTDYDAYYLVESYPLRKVGALHEGAHVLQRVYPSSAKALQKWIT